MNMGEAERDESFNRVIKNLRRRYPEPSCRQIANADVSTALSLVLPHVLSALTCFERAHPRMTGDIFLARLLRDVGGMDCYDRGRIKEAYRLTEAVKTILKSLGNHETHPLLSDVLVIQGLCIDFMALSKRDEGLRVRRECLKIRKNIFDSLKKVKTDDTIRLYNCHTDLVCSLQQINDFDSVLHHLNICLEQYKDIGSEDKEPYEYSKYYNQMAYVLLYNNEPDKAVEHAKKGYELAEKACPDTNYPWLYKFDYVNILFQHGSRKEEAFTLLQSIIKSHSEGRSIVYSEILALSMEQNLGIMAYLLGKFEFAE